MSGRRAALTQAEELLYMRAAMAKPGAPRWAFENAARAVAELRDQEPPAEDVQVAQYRNVLEARVLDLMRFDPRSLHEEHTRIALVDYCLREGLEMVGPVMISWECRAEVRTQPMSPES